MSLLNIIVSGLLLHVAATVPIDSNYQPLSPEAAALLEAWKPGGPPMWQISGQHQGDILLTPEQRNGIKGKGYRWPNAEVIYEISSEFDSKQKKLIQDTLKNEFLKTCVTFKERKSEKDYVYVTGGKSGCNSYVGRIGGKQQLNLDRTGCLYPSIISHEFIHAAGFDHEHNSYNRDSYITIILENVQKGWEYAFDKMSSKDDENFNEPYDYESVMHYEPYAFSKTRLDATIVTKDPYFQDIIGQALHPSEIDIRKLNKMYKC